MPTAQSIEVPPSDFCRQAASRLLACMALLAFLALHTSMVWHAPEHALNASMSAAVVSHSEQASPASDLCLKCLEDVANTVGLTSQAVQLAASRTEALQPRSQPVCCFATPVELANQRGPPAFLS